MQQDKEQKTVVGMDPGEILIYSLYVEEGLPRGELPYTENFDRIVKGYNQGMNKHETPHDIWRLLERVLKVGEKKIDAYLRQRRVLQVA